MNRIPMHPDTLIALAADAIDDRLGGYGPSGWECVRGTLRLDDGSVVLRVNSGGNLMQVLMILGQRGYRAEHVPDSRHGELIVVRSHVPRP